MSKELEVINQKIEEMEMFLRSTPFNEQTAAVVIGCCNATAALRQAKALHGIEVQLEELAGYLGGVISLLDSPGVSSLLAQFGIGGDNESEDDESEDEDEDEEKEDEA